MNLQQIVGAGVMLLFLADIFLTVLYARAGTGLLAPRWNRLVWAVLKALSGPFGSRRGAALSFAGPLIVILLILFWAFGLVVGVALIASKVKTRKDHVPFGPFLALGTLITILWGASILHWYTGS